MPRAVPTPARPEDHVRRILVADDFPAFSRHMGELMASLQEGDASAQRLANLVLRDYALTVKVIRTSNTVHYNRTGRPVQSATQAMMLLGAQTVRDLASGLLLFEQYRGRSPGLKELMLLSLLTAGHAREAAARLGIADPETAQLCGMFRNLGEVLAAAHLPAENAAILRAASQRSSGDARRARDAAAIAVLGCSLEDIGVAIAGDWGMPDAVCRGMRATGARHEDALALTTAFAHDLTAAIYREEPGPARQGVAALLERYGSSLKLSRDVLAAIADEAVAATRETFASAGVALDGLRLARQVASALSERTRAVVPTVPTAVAGPTAGPPETSTAGVGTPSAAPAPDGRDQAVASSTPADPHAAVGATDGPPVAGPPLAALRDRIARELDAAGADTATYDVHRMLLLALEAALRGGPFDRACFCPIDVAAGAFRARFGLGDGVEALLPRFALPLAGGTLGPALLRAEEVYLAQGTRLSLAEAQLLRGWGAASVALLPVVLDGTTIGAIHLDRRSSAAGLDATTLVYVRRVVAAAAGGLARRRGTQAPPPAASPVAAAPVEDGLPAVLVAPAVVAKSELVLRLLRGEPLATVAADAGVAADVLEGWRQEFLEGAMARLGA